MSNIGYLEGSYNVKKCVKAGGYITLPPPMERTVAESELVMINVLPLSYIHRFMPDTLSSFFDVHAWLKIFI